MRKILALSILVMVLLTSSAFAANQKAEQNDTKAPAQTEAVSDKPEKLTVSEMDERLAQGEADVLYIKTDDDKVLAYTDVAESRSLRKQIILAAPNSDMLRLYTNSEAVYQQMSKMLKDYEESNYSFDGYRIITDTDNPKKLENGNTVYRFWFMKLAKEKHDRRFPIGIGIGIGGRHHHHGGPWIGVGW